MAKPIRHKKVKLIVGFIFKEEGMLTKAQSLITKKWGPIDIESDIFNFCHTDYYKEEFGENLKKKLISLKNLVSPEGICKIKIETNKIENMLSKSGKRRINIDPGYISEGKLVLLSTKDYGHRIYLKDGIYAEVTLKFQGGTFRPQETTYPDYKTEEYINFFNRVRAVYRENPNT